MKKCKVCKKSFIPRFNALQVTCSIQCALELVQIKKEKERKKQIRRDIRNLNESSRSYQIKKAQAIFNKYIRLRDRDLPCISCGTKKSTQWDAGHYRTVGAHPGLRFNELNCHKQCSVCNNHRSGNIVDYRINLIKKIGKKNLEWLEGPHDKIKLSIEEIREISDYYKKKIKQIESYL